MSAPDLSPAVIVDATGAELLAPEPDLSPEQCKELQACGQGYLAVCGKIARKESELIYLYVEAGWWLMRAREAHRVRARGTDGETGRFVAIPDHDRGFAGWLEREHPGCPRRTAYRYIQGASNAGLTPESPLTAVEALRAEQRLKDRRLTDICRRPVDKAPPALPPGADATEDIAGPERLEMDREITWWTKTAESLEKRVESKTWMHLPARQRETLADLLAEIARDVRASLKPARALPGPAAKALTR